MVLTVYHERPGNCSGLLYVCIKVKLFIQLPTNIYEKYLVIDKVLVLFVSKGHNKGNVIKWDTVQSLSFMFAFVYTIMILKHLEYDLIVWDFEEKQKSLVSDLCMISNCAFL